MQKEEREVIQTLVDIDTGEYINIRDGDKLKIIRPKQQEAIDKSFKTKSLNEEIKDWNNELGGFVFVLFKYSDTILKQHKEITSEDITKLFYIATYVDFDGYLIYNDAHMTRKEMNDLLKLHISNFDIFFNKMKKLKIFILDDNKNIKINKDYFTKGNINNEITQYYGYTRVYINTIQYLFENVSYRKHKQLGMYFKIIPYIHRQQNTLSWNPNSNIDEMQLMNVKELKEILGYTSKGVRGFINELLSIRLNNGEAILGFFRAELDEGKSYIIVNPRVFYGGNFDLKGGRNAIIKWFNKN